MTIWNRFAADRKGTTALMFGLSVLPIMGLVGAAVDYTRASAVRSALLVATDRR